MKKIIVIVSSFLFFFHSELFSQTPGSLDPSFDTDGKVTTPIGGSDDFGFASVQQLDGKIIVAGYSYNGLDNDFALARYNTDGSLDNSFDIDGRLTFDFGSSNDAISCVIVQADGKIIAAGSSDNGSGFDFALVRFNTDGSFDNTFDLDGKLTTSFGSSDDGCYSAVLQPDGKIIAVGFSISGSDENFAIARYNANGSLDNSFDSDGKLTTGFLVNSTDYIMSVVLQPDGKILVAGTSDSDGSLDFALARYNVDGSLDVSFDADGILTTDFTFSSDNGNSIILQPDGKILVSGYSFTATQNDFALARYNNNGSLDNSFNIDGKILLDFGGSDDYSISMALQPDGKILLGGCSNIIVDYDFALVRYDSTGNLDTSFDGDGKLLTDFTSLDDWGRSIVFQQDGKIVVSGYTFNGVDYDFALARYFSGLNLGILDFSINNDLLIYPNPIAQESKLEYKLNSPEIISIALVNMNGQQIKTFLTNEQQEAGNHSQSLIFPEDLASGSHFLVISSPAGKVSLKIIK